MLGIEEIIGYKFRDEGWLKQALTHSSYITSVKRKNDDCENVQSYERLEFLGDAVLQLVISEFLFFNFGEEQEGKLARRRSSMVCGETLAKIAKEMGIGQYIILSESEEKNNGKENESILEDVMEALIAAIHLDGGFKEAEKFIYRYFKQYLTKHHKVIKDAKSALQEWAQKKSLSIPEYKLVKQEGTSHNPTFTVSVKLEGYDVIEEDGTSKKKAERKAAETFIKKHNIEQ